MRKLVLATVGAAALAIGSAASAQGTGGTVTYANDLGAGGSFVTSFNQANLTNPFTSTLTFTTSSTGFLNLFFGSTATDATNDTDFSSAILTGTGLGAGVSVDQILGDPNETRAINNLALGIGSFTLTIMGTPGTQNGGFGGQAAFLATPPIPEPGTWAMMLLGFGAIGFSVRRQRRSNALPQVA